MTEGHKHVEAGSTTHDRRVVPATGRNPVHTARILLPLAFAVITTFVIAVTAGNFGGVRLAAAALIGAGAGFALYHASFGFTSGWRRFIVDRRADGLRAQALMIALTVACTVPLIGWGQSIGIAAGGFVFPFGLGSALGAALFGIGMQLAGGCGSGTLFAAGGGSTRMLITLFAFVAGSVAATAHWSFWQGLPSLPPLSLVVEFGVGPTLALTLLAGGALVTFANRAEQRRHGHLQPDRQAGSILSGPWSGRQGAVALAAVGVATLLVLGRPWGFTSAFALWGAKFLAAGGIDVAAWDYWSGQRQALDAPVLADGTSVMDFGIMLGAMAAAALAGRFRPVWRLSIRDIATALAGGLLMGYGARLSYGCNIGAYVGGIISGSLHGWLWLGFAFAGSLAGVALRRRLGMT